MRKSLTRCRWHAAVIPFAVAIVLSLVMVAPGAQRAAAQNAVTVDIVDFAFSPATMTIAAGTTVTWVNQGAAPHTATGDNGEFDTGQLAPDQSGSVTFNTPGTYTYHCTIHPNMTATIVVTAAGGTPQMPTTGTGQAADGMAAGFLAALAALGSAILVLGVVIRQRTA